MISSMIWRQRLNSEASGTLPFIAMKKSIRDKLQRVLPIFPIPSIGIEWNLEDRRESLCYKPNRVWNIDSGIFQVLFFLFVLKCRLITFEIINKKLNLNIFGIKIYNLPLGRWMQVSWCWRWHSPMVLPLAFQLQGDIDEGSLSKPATRTKQQLFYH